MGGTIGAARHHRRGDRVNQTRARRMLRCMSPELAEADIRPLDGSSRFVKGFGCRPSQTVLLAPAAGVRNPPRDETAGSGTRSCSGLYGDLRDARDLEARSFPTGVGLEWVHNLDVPAQILLNGESTFFIFRDFNELNEIWCGKNIICYNLSVIEPHSDLQRAKDRVIFLRTEKTSIPSNGYCFQLLVLLTMITASSMHRSHHANR